MPKLLSFADCAYFKRSFYCIVKYNAPALTKDLYILFNFYSAILAREQSQ